MVIEEDKREKEDFLLEVSLERGVHKTPSGHRKALVDWSQKEGKRQAWRGVWLSHGFEDESLKT